MTERRLLILASLLLALAVTTGAFGAHGLRRLVAPEWLEIWQTAVLYHLIHALGLLGIAALAPGLGGLRTNRLLWVCVWLLLAGIVLFSGSLYGLVLTTSPWLGAVTPAGGVAWLSGWLLLALTAWRQADKPEK